MGGMMGPQAWGLLVLGVLLIACGHLTEGKKYYQGDYEGYTVRCTIGVQHQPVKPPDSPPFDACKMLKYGLPTGVVGDKCMSVNKIDQSYYTLYEVTFYLSSGEDSAYHSMQYLLGNFDVDAAELAYGDKYVPGTLQFYDIDECADRTSKCSPNAACYNEWATYKCTCLDGYKDNSGPEDRRGYKCDKDEVPPGGGLDLQIWVYVLIALAVFMVLMLVICCCCCYTGSNDCCPGMHQSHTKVTKHIQIMEPQEEKKIIIQVDHTAPVAACDPTISGPSAFIANSGYDGKVYVGSGQPMQATRALPWADGSSIQTVNPPVQQVQYIQEEPQQVQYIQEEPQQVQYIQELPQQVQIIQQPDPQPIYSAPVTTQYVYN